MADISKMVKFVLLGVDRSASKALRGVGNETKKTHGLLGKLGGMGKMAGLALVGGLATAGIAAVKFGGDSLAAYADAEKSQAKLTDAYKRFPGIADVNIESLRKYNQALQRKTGADADDIAASQASLAMFGLTGKQIKSTTPLLIDYANKTGKSLPDAAKTMGKALIGNTKALKDMGISYKPTGNKAKDYANIMGLLKDKVGGYTASIPEAETKSKILAASFGDLQEAVGAKLQPAMIALTDAGLGMLDWLDKNPELVQGVSTAFDALGKMMRWFWNTVLLPVVKFWISSNAKVAEGLGTILEATGKMTGNKDLENFGAGIKKAAIATGKWADSLQAIPEEVAPKVDARTDAAKKKVVEIDGKIKGLKDKIVTAHAKGDDKEVRRLKKRMEDLQRQKFKATITAAVTMNKSKDEIVYNMTGQGHVKFTARRRGGYTPPGWTLYGEEGPELARTTRPSFVYTAAQTAQMWAGASAASIGSSGGGRGSVVIVHQHFSVPPNADLAAIGRVNRDSLLALKGLLGGRDLGIA